MTGKRTRLRGLLSACAVAPLLVLAACSRTTDNGGNAGDKAEAARAFAQCMRDNGVPDYPDPDPAGKFPKDAERQAHDDPKFQAANEKCRKDLPQHGGGR